MLALPCVGRPGGHSRADTPVPIPNTEVKRPHADGTTVFRGRVGSRRAFICPGPTNGRLHIDGEGRFCVLFLFPDILHVFYFIHFLPCFSPVALVQGTPFYYDGNNSLGIEGIFMQITLDNLQRSYGNLHAVNGVSLSIPSNTIYGIIGKSGAGKSTLVRLISLLESPDGGEVYFDDVRVDNLSKRTMIGRRRRVGMIFQNFNLFSSRNAEENIAYPMEINGISKEVIKKRVDELLALVALEGRGKASISTLSGGQKQRVAIARALACKPDILFCDEATSALDPQTTHSILSLLKEIQKKMSLTVIMITHQMEVVRDACEQVAVLDDGKVVEQGFVTDIFANPTSEVTKDFLAHLVGVDESASHQDKMVQWSKKIGTYTLRFRGDTTDLPILSRITKELGVEFNIRAGGVQKVGDVEIGTMVVDISGDEVIKRKAIDALKSQGVLVEEEGKV